MATYSFVELSKENRVHVTLRVPKSTADTIEKYSASHNMTKTDAYIYFLQRGLESSRLLGQQAHYAEIDGKLDEILRLLRPDE